jgi:ATP-dependent DNA helicase RecG
LIVYSNGARNGASNGAGNGAEEILNQVIYGRVKDVLEVVESWISREDLFEKIGLSKQSKNRVKYLYPLLDFGWIEMKYPAKRTYPEQQYKISESGKRLLSLIK